jgi:hypothetical protein
MRPAVPSLDSGQDVALEIGAGGARELGDEIVHA